MLESSSLPSQIRSMIHADLACVLAWRNHPDVRRYMYSQHEITLVEHQQWFERTLTDRKKHLLIFEANHQALGFVNFNESDNGGIAALRHAFTQLKLHKVCGQALAYNERSIQFHKTLGFQQEAILGDQHFDGERYHHVICFGLLRRDWQVNP